MKHVVMNWCVVLTMIFMGNMCCMAQDDFEVGYDYLYSAAHRVKVRQVVTCFKNNQKLWNGDYVRQMNGMICIYRDTVCITSGRQVWLEHTGHYTIAENDGTQKLVDANGKWTGVHGEELTMLWNGVVCVLQDGYYSLFTTDNKQIESVQSDRVIELYYNGYYCCHLGAYFVVVSPSGERVKNAYGNVKPGLSEDGLWQCRQDGNIVKVDKKGRVHK